MMNNKIQVGSLVYNEHFPEYYGIVLKIYKNKYEKILIDVYWLNKEWIGTISEIFYLNSYKLMNENNYCKKV